MYVYIIRICWCTVCKDTKQFAFTGYPRVKLLIKSKQKQIKLTNAYFYSIFLIQDGRIEMQ